jgi:hypothetical protein
MRKSHRVKPGAYEEVRQIIADIQALETRAHQVKMTATAQALNVAKNAAGWELAEAMEINGDNVCT